MAKLAYVLPSLGSLSFIIYNKIAGSNPALTATKLKSMNWFKDKFIEYVSTFFDVCCIIIEAIFEDFGD